MRRSFLALLLAITSLSVAAPASAKPKRNPCTVLSAGYNDLYAGVVALNSSGQYKPGATAQNALNQVTAAMKKISCTNDNTTDVYSYYEGAQAYLSSAILRQNNYPPAGGGQGHENQALALAQIAMTQYLAPNELLPTILHGSNGATLTLDTNSYESYANSNGLSFNYNGYTLAT